MCGFAGITNTNPNILDHKLILNNLSHRGPDTSGKFFNKEICLFHTRLSILDLSESASQPMIDKKTKITIVYNGEIYNFKELKKKLPEENFCSKSDTEVLLKLYIKFGCSFLNMLEGMFSFAIWDPKKKQTILARDRFGIKPLFYLFKKKKLSFASEIKALLSLGHEKQINFKTISEYLTLGMPGVLDNTFFKNVRNFPPGNYMLFKNGKIKIKKFWSIEEEFKDSSNFENNKSTEKKTYEKLKSSVKKHLISDVPVGLCLSSGTDSTLLLFLLNELGVKNINTFTYGFIESKYNEIRKVKNSRLNNNIIHNSRIITPFNFLKNLEKAIFQFETPLGGLGTLGLWQLFSLAKEKKIPVILSGEGLDETFAGYKYYIYYYLYDLIIEKKFDLINNNLKNIKKNFGLVFESKKDFFNKFSKINNTPLMAPDSTFLSGDNFLSNIYKEKFNIKYPKTTKISNLSFLKQRMFDDIFIYKIPKLLSYLDRSSMSWGVESRVPFIDNNLLNHTFKISSNNFFKNSTNKYIPKKLLKKFNYYLKNNQNKLFVSTPQREWLKYKIDNKILEYIRNGNLVKKNIIKFDLFEKKYKKYNKQEKLGNSFFIWKILNLEAMMRVFFN